MKCIIQNYGKSVEYSRGVCIKNWHSLPWLMRTAKYTVYFNITDDRILSNHRSDFGETFSVRV